MATVIETKCTLLSNDHAGNVRYIEKQGMNGWELKAYVAVNGVWQGIFQRRRSIEHLKREQRAAQVAAEAAAT